MRNPYQYPSLNHKLDFFILAQAHNSQEPVKKHQHFNYNFGIIQSNFVIAEPMKLSIKRSIQMVEYNGDFISSSNNKDIEFVDVKLLYNKLCLQLLANHSITCTMIRQVIKIDNKNDESLKL